MGVVTFSMLGKPRLSHIVQSSSVANRFSMPVSDPQLPTYSSSSMLASRTVLPPCAESRGALPLLLLSPLPRTSFSASSRVGCTDMHV